MKKTGTLNGGLLTSKDMCELLKVTDRTLRRMKSTGELPKPLKLRRLDRWHPAIVQAWLDGGCKPGAA